MVAGVWTQQCPCRELPCRDFTCKQCPDLVGGWDLFPFSAHHGLIKGLQNEVDYWCQLGTYAHSGHCWLHSALRVWPGNWAPGGMGWNRTPLIIVAQTESPSSCGTMEPSHPLPAGSWKACKTCLAGLKSARGSFFFPPQE